MIKLFRFLKPYRLQIFAVLVLIFFQVLADLYLPTLMSEIIDKGVMSGDTNFILRIGGFMLLITSLSMVCAFGSSWLSSVSATSFGASLRSMIFRKIEGFTLHEFDKYGTATLITRTTNDITQVQMVTMMILRMMVMAPMMAIGGVFMAFSKDGPLTLTLAVAIPILTIVITILASIAMPLFKSIQEKLDKLNLVLRESLTGIRVIRAFNRTAREEERFNNANEDLTKTYINVNRIMAFMMPSMMLIMNLTSVSILYFGIIRIDAGNMEMGSLIAFTQYAMQIMFSFLMMSMMFIMVPRAQAASERILEILNEKAEIQDPVVPVKSTGLEGVLEFKNVSFKYHGAEQYALKDISFKTEKGEFIAIIGSTGSGKSTLSKLIPRFYDVESGSILIDNVDVKQMMQKDLRSKIAYVPQKSVLFKGSIATNVRFGNENASDSEIRDASEIAQAADFIAEMEGSYEHEISQGGTNVSGGQKQRLSIARALARKSEFYIFDDSFSALDFKTDAKLRASLRTRVKGATVLLIAQRVGTVMDADKIIVLDNGNLVGIGKHNELLKTCPIYKEIAASQLSLEALSCAIIIIILKKMKLIQIKICLL